MKFDVIRAIEACYAPAPDDRDWLAGLLDTFGPLDEGPGFVAWVFRFVPGGSRVIECSAASSGIPPSVRLEMDFAFDKAYESMPPDLARRHLAPSPTVEYALRRAIRLGPPALEEAMRFYVQRLGAADLLGVFAGEPVGRTVLIAHGTPAGRPLLPARTLHQLTLFSAHLSSSARLRRALSDSSETVRDSPTEAVLDPRGRILDVSGGARPKEARQSLADAVRRMDRARGALRRADPEEALGLWRGLVDGTWSLVDQCDSDGKRYVLARRNEPGVRDPKALTQRERSVAAFAAMGHQNKFIGYLLGLSAGTVSEHLRSAQRKLGLSSRAALVQWFAHLIEVGL